MIKEQFYTQVDVLQKRIRDTQNDNIHKAAQIIANSVINKGAVHLFDTGHIIDSEMYNRAGGLVLMRRFRYNINVENSSFKRDNSDKDTSMEGLAKFALKASTVKPGDVMIIGSVSGKTLNVIDLAYECKKMGVSVIGVTSVEYSSQLSTTHSCGKRLYELSDVAIDNCAPFGDAMIKLDNIEAPCCPASGLAAAYIMWAINAELIEMLLDAGTTPSVLKSVNFAPNVEYNNNLYKRYDEEGI